MDRDAIARVTDRMFYRTLEVRRMRARGADASPRYLAELAVLGRGLESAVAPEALERAAAELAKHPLEVPSVEVDVREGYAKWAPQYDGEANPLIMIEEPATLELIGDVAGLDVLDAACGTGRYALRLAQAGARVCGVDVSEEMLAVARTKHDEQGLDVELRLGELTALPYPDASFDVAVCALTFCHLPDLRPPTAELARVLRPGGRLVISDFHPMGLRIGWRTVVRHADGRYLIENYQHLVGDFVAALLAAGLVLKALREEVVDDRALAVLTEEQIVGERGWPAALVIAAERREEAGHG
jgi:ubiquinone/menaquinone biosynthesis C-methylase UbiE